MTKTQSLKIACFSLLVLILLFFGGKIFQPKWMYGDSPITLQVGGFYEEPEESIDVLLLGSCNMYNAFNPLILWEKYGVTSYVFGSSDQELWTSYYYLKEALEYQKPKLVVLETLFLTHGDAPNEFYNRRAADYMRLSSHKLGLINAYITIEQEWKEGQGDQIVEPIFNYSNYVLPVLRYHSRWNELEEEDFEYWSEKKSYVTKGGTPVFRHTTYEYNRDYMAPSAQSVVIKDKAYSYFSEIIELCKSNGIELVLVKSFSAYFWNDAQHKAVAQLADEYDVPFLDFNVEFQSYGFDLDTDFYSTTGERLNAYGMQKLSDFLSDYIVENYNIAPRTDDADLVDWWNQGIERYNEDVLNARESDPFWERVRLLNKR